MNSLNSANVPLQAVLLTMLLEKIDNLSNQVGGMNVTTGELKQSVDSLTARIGALESSVLKAKTETEVKLNDVVDDKREEGALEPLKEAETSPVVEAKKEPKIKPQQGFGDKFNKKQGEWECQTCYLRNSPSSTICASCGMGKDDKEASPPATSSAPAAAFKPTTFSSAGKAHFSFGTNKSAPSFGSASTTTSTMAPAKTEVKTIEPKPAETKSLFGTTKPFSATAAPLPVNAETSTTQPKPVGTSLFGSASSFLKPAAQSAAKPEAKPAESKSLFGSTKTFSFGPPNPAATITSPFANANHFGAKSATDGAQPKTLFGGSSLSFSSFASGTSFLNKQTTDSANNSFGAQKSATFGKGETGNNKNEEESENPEEYVPDAHYEPVVPLPDKIEVVTGEEAEQILFKNRAKLYIFNSDTKEVKERGVGDMKVLFHPENKTYRVVMRREQVHKICANFRITKGMSIADKPGLKNCGIVSCVDFSENLQTGALTVFYVRFRDDDVYEEFKQLIGDIAANAQSTLKETTPKKDIPQGTVFSEPPYAFYGEEAEEEEYEEEPEKQLENLDQDGGEARSDDAADILFESNCKVTLGAAYKSPLTGDLPSEVHENASLFVLVSDDGIYPVYFDDGAGTEVFLHYVQNDSNYKKDGKRITFTANGLNGGRKAVTCEFKDDAVADEAFKIFTYCSDTTRFVDYDHED